MRRFRSRSRRHSAVRRESDWWHVISVGHVAPNESSAAWLVPPDSDFSHYPTVENSTDRTVVKLVIQGTMFAASNSVGAPCPVMAAMGIIVCPEDTASGLPAPNDFPLQTARAPWLYRVALVGQTSSDGPDNVVFEVPLNPSGGGNTAAAMTAKRKLPDRHGLAIIFAGDASSAGLDVAFGYDVRTLVLK